MHPTYLVCGEVQNVEMSHMTLTTPTASHATAYVLCKMSL